MNNIKKFYKNNETIINFLLLCYGAFLVLGYFNIIGNHSPDTYALLIGVGLIGLEGTFFAQKYLLKSKRGK